MFAIIDIETCGGRYEFRKGRITEICIIVHDGLQVVDKFSTLINPECYISTYFTGLTGITNEMVADAPKFHEVAKKIIEMTQDCLFVAHNVSFDYGFIRDEFAALGYTYKRETLCTVRLSRKLMPGKISYSLGKLCQSLGIENHARHRAEGDAMATVQLFEKLLELKNIHPQLKNQGVEELMARRIDKMKSYILDQLPEACGVYYFRDREQNIIYIGKSVNMYRRAISHFNTKELKGKKMLNDLYHTDHVKTGSELVALLLEAEEIKKHKPKYNRMRKSEAFSHCIEWYLDDQNIICFKISLYEETKNALLSFVSYAAARERLESWIDDYSLCLRYCHLTTEDSVCFHHQIKKCRGICAGEEEIESYNRRAQEILDQIIFKHRYFALIDKGRHDEERSIILVENGHYVGFGYMDSSSSFSSLEECRSYITPKRYFPDTDDLIRGYLKQHHLKTIVFKEKESHYSI